MISPGLLNVTMNGAANWPVVVQSATASVNFESFAVDKSSFNKIV